MDESSVQMGDDVSDLFNSTFDNTNINSYIWVDETFTQVLEETLESILPLNEHVSLGSRLLMYFNNIQEDDVALGNLFDTLPQLDILLGYNLNDEEYGLFKLVLDIIEYSLLRLDGPSYSNYESIFLPIMETFLHRCNSIDSMNSQRGEIGQEFFKPMANAEEYIAYYKNRISALKMFSFSFGGTKLKQ